MVTKYDQVRSKLGTKIFALPANNGFGISVTLKSSASDVTNDWGEVTGHTYNESSVVFVPYNTVGGRSNHLPFGDLKEGELDAAFAYDTDISVGDLITWDSQDYTIEQIDPSYLGAKVVQIARLSKVQE